MKQLFNKTAFVTGGASGIGLAIAREFLDNHMNVVIADVRQDHLDAAKAALSDRQDRAAFLRVDVTDREAMAEAANETERLFGKIHVLCNNAGIGDGVPLDRASYEDWDWVLNVNLGGVINGIVTFVPRIKAHGQGGHIVNTASMHSFLALPSWGGIYSASKFAPGLEPIAAACARTLQHRGLRTPSGTGLDEHWRIGRVTSGAP